MFDLNADWAIIAKTLCSDPALSRLAEAEEGLRVPGCWSSFELTTRAILEQNVSLARAAGFTSQLVKTLGEPFSPTSKLTHLFPTPQTLAAANLAGSGLPAAKAKTIGALGCAVCEQQIKFEGVTDSEALLRQLCQIPGIEKSTAQYVAMRALRDPDAFPSADPVLRHAAAARTASDLESRSEHWRPWRSYAAVLLWQSADNLTSQRPERRPRSASVGEIRSARSHRESTMHFESR